MIKLLFVEDDERAIRHARDRVQESHPDIQCEVKDFEEAIDWIRKNPPDIISLDLLSGGLSGEPAVAGQSVFEQVWQNHFCPVIVYSAQPDAEEEGRPPHPFLVTIQKGSGSPERFATAVGQFRPQIDALRDAQNHVRREFNTAMKELAPTVFLETSSTIERQRIIVRSGRRRLAAQMDDFSDYEGEDAKLLAPWEHYLCPPVSKDLLLGDILHKTGEAIVANAFRVVLTPSCDLVASSGRKPKVSQILVAKCVEMKEGLSKVAINLGKKAKNDESKMEEFHSKLKLELTQAFIRNIIPFPKFGSQIPTMAADLRQLELIDFGQDGSLESFRRVSSIDSPFRELISWAYMQTACRPGLPDRNVDEWSREIVNLYVDN